MIPSGLRFQVGLPFPASALNGFKADFAGDCPVAERGFEDLVARELQRLTAAIPPQDLAVQWDVAYEVLDLEGVLAWTAPGAWERFAGPVSRLTRLIPPEVLVGYHLCYGTFPEWPMYEARDMALLVRLANYAVANSGRPVDWLHLAGPRYLRSEDAGFFRPLADLDAGDARVYLGIVLPVDGAAGRLRRSPVLRVRPPARPGRHRNHARPPAGGPGLPRLSPAGPQPGSTRITSSVRGPCTPSTRDSSMSLVADGPLIQVSGWPERGASRSIASGTSSTTWSARTRHRW